MFRVCVCGMWPAVICAQTENVENRGVPYSNGPRDGPEAFHPLFVYGCTEFKRSQEWSPGTPPVVVMLCELRLEYDDKPKPAYGWHQRKTGALPR